MAFPFASRRSTAASRPLAAQRIGALVAAFACLALGAYLALNQRDQSRLSDANRLGLERRYGRALAEARRVTRPPGTTRALLIRAYAAQALERHGDAAALFRRAAERHPRSWSLHRDWAISLRALGREREARKQLDVASTLNPRLAIPPGF
jgi:Flp pilus assembly protein TadD